ncbi:biopolymer transport protein ExbD [Rubripirellula obstinata]|uniref:Biopolymer transport protein ExbD n=1 Tax=Rubripirellula obstinata TaxID=406547 RepID=A0A5B1CCP9_9BACT|nr:biopolymer transporter ExbD [Rubripirellula obstinata]KAA1258907.1 biopolymer transport protein ExbD [Rubripirellula obstinata]
MAKHVKSEDVTINLTPMIDVVFLLVIFFMVGSKFSEAESRIKVNVPSVGEMRSLARVPDERVVAIGVDGTLTLDETPMTMSQLTETLRREHENYPGMKVAVRGEASGSIQQMVEVLHAVRVAGVDQIGIATKKVQR